MPADGAAPGADVEPAIFAQRIDDRPAGRLERRAELVISALHLVGVVVEPLARAEVVLHIIYPPLGERARILLDMAVAAFIAGAALRSGRCVDAELEAAA